METFGFSRTEIRGILVVLILIILLAILPRIYFRYQQRGLQIHQTAEEKEALAQWAREMNEHIGIKEKEKKKGWIDYEKTAYAERGYKRKTFPKSTTSDRSYKKSTYTKPAEPTEIHLNHATAEILQGINGIGPHAL